jgi:pimeloyl-ACP methyl ester carboxylesterase
MAPGAARELDSDWRPYAARAAASVPVGIVHGEADQGASGEGAERRIAARVVVPVPGAGHYLHATQARQTAAAVSEAVERLVTGPW